LEDHCRTDELVDLSGVSWSSFQWILGEELQLKRVAVHKAFIVKQFLTKNSMTQLIHPISLHATSFYSPEYKKPSKENVLRTWKR
jgi:hypothetical protein